jgi:hypothetical protein
MEPHSDSETSPMCSLSEDEHDIKEEEHPLPTPFCDARVSVYFYIFIILSARNLFILV